MTTSSRAWLRPTMEYGPLVVFFVAYSLYNLFVATGALMVATVIAIIASYVVERRVPIILIVTAVIVLIFGGLTLILKDERFIKMKPTAVYGLFAVVLLGGLMIGRSPLKRLLSGAWQMTEQGWRTLTLRFGLFFAVMAVLNEIVWRTQTTSIWVDYKIFGTTVLMLIFTACQAPLIMRHQIDEEENTPAE